MTLEEIISNLDSIDDSLTICVARTPIWTKNSEAELHPSNLAVKDFPLPYFLEISVAKEVLEAWSFARDGRLPSLEQKCEAIIYYAENDAFVHP